jgi:hypothetical protein
MRKIMFCVAAMTSLIALAQTTPKALLLEINGNTASTVAMLEGNKWLPINDVLPRTAVPLLESGKTFSLLTDVGLVGVGKLTGNLQAGRCGSEKNLSTTTKLSRQIYGLVAPWKVTPRKIERLALNNAVYNKVMAVELSARGIKAPVQMTQILKTDLDGDKTDEVIMVAQRPALSANYDIIGTGFAVKAHDYALTIVRKLTTGGVKTFVLREAWIQKDFDMQKYSESGGDPPFRFAQWVNGIADLNGDGTMEVLVNSVLWEGYGFEVFHWNQKNFPLLFDWGCA